MPEIVSNLVSTIIPVHNRPVMVREAVESVLAQTYRPIEVIVADDGSTDETPDVGRALERECPGVVRYVWNPKRGAGPARESGRQLARGEFIQHLDSDDRLLPDKFAVQVKALRDNPSCGAAYGFIRFCPEDEPPRVAPFKLTGETRDYLFPRLLIDRWWNTTCPLFRRSVCDAVGPWTDLQYSQDWEYDARVGSLGTRLTHTRAFVCEQRQHSAKRQTGHGGWLEAPDRVRFFSLLCAHATKAGVPTNCPEMRHFSRWVFAEARFCAIEGHTQVASRLLALAVRTAERPTALRAYGVLAHVAGWATWARTSEGAYRLVRKRPGRRTMKLSWM